MNDCGEKTMFTPSITTNTVESGSITFSFDFGVFGTTQTTEYVEVLDFEHDYLDVCDISTTSALYARVINLPSTGCSEVDASIETGESLSVICQEITLNSGFEVKNGGTLVIETYNCE